MPLTNYQELLEAGVHFGHLSRKWNPKMAPYIFMERNGIHIIDLNKTVEKIEEAAGVLEKIVRSGRKVLFVATKKQAKTIVEELIKGTGMPYITERWPGGMLTNFHTIRKAVKKMETIDKMAADGTFENISKKERLQILREREKLQRDLGSIADLIRLPAALFIVDIQRERIALAEARRLNIPTIAVVDTNSDPTLVDYPIPANDDSSNSISLIAKIIVGVVMKSIEERKIDQEAEALALSKEKEVTEEESKKKRHRRRHRRDKVKVGSSMERRPPETTPETGDTKKEAQPMTS